MPSEKQRTQQNSANIFHFKRSRLNSLFTEAMKYPVIIVCAGAGYGKTTAVHDFVKEYQATTVWVQLSERDNTGGRFWENFSHSMTLINNTPFAISIKKLGFPDTQEKLKQYLDILHDYADKKRRIIVFDDCHVIENTAVIRFVEESIRNLPIGTTLILISRSTPKINVTSMVSSDLFFQFSEDELRFTENEIAQYFRKQDISLQPDSLRKIMQDTDGWAFALNYIARTYNKAPGYEGYLRSAVKANIFKFMEAEIWDLISSQLQNFLIRLSLIGHLSVELIVLLAGPEKELIIEFEKQNAYIRKDSYINAYLIHPLFLEFLSIKQDLLSKNQKHETYTIAGNWCRKNNFFIDALSYYEKAGDYESIVLLFNTLPVKLPYDIACFAAEILDRAPEEAFNSVKYLVSKHLNSYMSQGLWQKAMELAEYYETKYQKLQPNNSFRIDTLASIYYCQALMRISMGLTEDRYDFDQYFEKLNTCYPESTDPGKLIKPCPGPWICSVGSARKGALEEFINTYKRSVKYISRCFRCPETGEDNLAYGELKFYQGDIQTAETYINKTLTSARKNNHPEIAHRALFYILHIAVMQGNFSKAEQALKDMAANLNDIDYPNRFVDYDISLCWYYCVLGIKEKVPDWLNENFSFYSNAGFIENYSNLAKTHYFYITRNYPSVLSYIQNMKQRESFLFGRILMLAIEACIYYKMKEKEKAYKTLEEGYITASPNNIITPFIELGKDMRTLTAFALKNKKDNIPKSWLEDINRKSTAYAKRLTHVITKYKQAFGISNINAISPRENEILTDLSHGLTRTEIASNRNLSINTVKMIINNIYIKLGAENLVDAIRIATEKKII